jgi:hypothetical protein
MPNTTNPCPQKPTIDDEAMEAKGHIDKVLMDATLLPSLKSELNLAIEHLKNITGDHHHH